jgi:choloylglycine hydrolase
VSLSKLDLKPGAPVRKLTIQDGEMFSGEVSADFKDATPFAFLPATPPAP